MSANPDGLGILSFAGTIVTLPSFNNTSTHRARFRQRRSWSLREAQRRGRWKVPIGVARTSNATMPRLIHRFCCMIRFVARLSEVASGRLLRLSAIKAMGLPLCIATATTVGLSQAITDNKQGVVIALLCLC